MRERVWREVVNSRVKSTSLTGPMGKNTLTAVKSSAQSKDRHYFGMLLPFFFFIRLYIVAVSLIAVACACKIAIYIADGG